MKQTHSYKDSIFNAIGSSLNLKLKNLRFFPTVSALPAEDYKLFSLLDIVPDGKPIFNTSNDTPRFSKTYEQLLFSQEDSFVVNIANKNFKNKEYWLTNNLPKVPLYTPPYQGVSNAVVKGSSFDFRLDSSDYPVLVEKIFPSFPGFILDQTLLDFNQLAASERFIVKLHFDKIVNLPVSAGGWFSSAAFTKAFKNKKWVSKPGAITWEHLFGQEGILKYICNGIIIASGVLLEIQSFGEYDKIMVDALKNNKATSAWPFYLHGENIVQDYTLEQDNSIKITIKSPPNEVLLLAIEAANIDGLMG